MCTDVSGSGVANELQSVSRRQKEFLPERRCESRCIEILVFVLPIYWLNCSLGEWDSICAFDSSHSLGIHRQHYAINCNWLAFPEFTQQVMWELLHLPLNALCLIAGIDHFDGQKAAFSTREWRWWMLLILISITPKVLSRKYHPFFWTAWWKSLREELMSLITSWNLVSD